MQSGLKNKADSKTRKLVTEAKNLVAGNRQVCAEIDFFRAISLLKANKLEEGVRSLAAILAEYADWFSNPDSRDVYEMIQLERPLVRC